MNPSPEDAANTKTLLGGVGAALLAVCTWLWAYTHRKIEDRVNKTDFDTYTKAAAEQRDAIHEELKVQRGHIAKVFDQMKDMNEKNHDRHIELLNAIHDRPKK